MRKNKNSILNVTILVLIAKFFAFLKEFVLSYYFGVSVTTDAYSIAYTIPITIMSLVAVGVNTSYIPVYNKVLVESDEEGANNFSNNVICIVFWFSLFVFVLIELLTGPIIKLFAGGFTEDTASLSIRLTRYMAAAVFFIGYINIMSAYVQLKNKYYLVPFCELGLYIFSIIGIVVGALFDIRFLSIGVLCGYLLESIILTVTAVRCKYCYSFELFPKNKYLGEFFGLIGPVIIGSIASDINKIVDKTLASYAMEGGISILNYAHKIDEAVIAIFVASLVAVAYPKISRAVSEKKQDIVQILVKKDVCYLMFLVLPIFWGILFYSRDIVNLLFLRGAFTKTDAANVSLAFILYALGIVPTALRKYVVRIYYSYSDTKTTAFNSFVVIAFNILVSILLSFVWGIYGIALGSTLSIWLGFTHLAIKLKKHIKVQVRSLISPIFRIVLACLSMIIVSKTIQIILSRYLDNGNTVFIICMFVAVLVYFVFIKILRLEYLIKHVRAGKEKNDE